jgi:hypothetical protein
MELAISEALNVPRQLRDREPSVGAIAVRGDELLGTSYRGEPFVSEVRLEKLKDD